MKIGSWPGPAWLNGRARTMSSPCASAYTPASRSPADLDTAYGFAGRERRRPRRPAVAPGRRRPRMSSPTPPAPAGEAWRIASSTLTALATLSITVSDGSSHERPTVAERREVVDDFGLHRADRIEHGVRIAEVDGDAASPTPPRGSRHARQPDHLVTGLDAGARQAPSRESRRTGDQDPHALLAAPLVVGPTDRVLERAVAVAGVVRLGLERCRLGLGVQPPLQLAQDDSEQQVPPSGLGEGTAVAGRASAARLRAGWRRSVIVASGHRAKFSASASSGPRVTGGSGDEPARGSRRRRRTAAPFWMCSASPAGIPAVAARHRLVRAARRRRSGCRRPACRAAARAPIPPPRPRRRRRPSERPRAVDARAQDSQL